VVSGSREALLGSNQRTPNPEVPKKLKHNPKIVAWPEIHIVNWSEPGLIETCLRFAVQILTISIVYWLQGWLISV
jgi:hypothetical protein